MGKASVMGVLRKTICATFLKRVTLLSTHSAGFESFELC